MIRLDLASLLLAVDDSPFAESATRYAVFFTQRLSLPLRALSVLDSRVASAPAVLDSDMGDMALMMPEYDAGVQDVLKLRAEEVKTKTETLMKGLELETALELATGLPAEEVLSATTSGTLVVLGKQGESAEYGGAPRLGSVAERVVRRAEGTVLLVPQTFEEPRRLLLGYDGSGGAKEALEVALGLSERLELPLLALSVDDDLEAAEAQLAEVRERARRDDLQLETQALSGAPVEAILEATEPGDIIAIGAFGAGRVAEFFRGSTTSHIVRGAEVPVLLHS